MKYLILLLLTISSIYYSFGQACSSPFIECDASFTVALSNNDDGSTSLIPIPFNFCFYGNSYSGLFINNNGCISFGAPLSSFSSTPFPFISTSGLIAPLWSDVDTRLGNGSVKYKITPSAIIICYDSVGYYNSHGDKRNTFQVILTNGNDPLISNGNLSFRYKDMQWTTGDASSGLNGFGGTPATVGVNSGNGSSYFAIGRFSENNSYFDGPLGNPDGINWLDNKQFNINVCDTIITKPVYYGPSTCDTIQICSINDTVTLPLNFISLDTNLLITSVNFNNGGLVNSQIVTSTNTTNSINTLSIVAGTGNSGLYYPSVTVINNNIPADTVIISYIVELDTTNGGIGLIANFTFNPPSSCGPVTTNFSPNQQATNINYSWNFGVNNSMSDTSSQMTPSFTFTDSGTYFVKLKVNSTNYCGSTVDSIIQAITISSDSVGTNYLDSICLGDTILLIPNPADNYSWANSSSLNVLPNFNAEANPTSTSQYFLTSTSDGCSKTDTFTLNVVLPNPISLDFTIYENSCNPVMAQMTPTINSNQIAYFWDFGEPGINSDTSILAIGNYYYFNAGSFDITLITNSSDVCRNYKDTVVKTIVIAPYVSSYSFYDTICAGDTLTLTAISADIYNWSPNSNITSLTDSVTQVYPNTSTYYLQYSWTNGCNRQDTFNVIVNAPTQINVDFSSPSFNGCSPLTASFLPSSIPANSQFHWDFGISGTTSDTSSQVFPFHTFINPGVYPVQMSITTNEYCTVYNPVIHNVTVFPTPPQFHIYDTICFGDSVILATSGGNLYNWSPITSLNFLSDSVAIASPTSNITYIVYISTSHCTGIDTFSFQVRNQIPVNFDSIPNIVCDYTADFTLNAMPTGGQFSGPGILNNTFSPSTAGLGTHVLSYTYTDSISCSATVSQTIVVDGCSSITDLENSGVSIYPNPTNKSVKIEFINSTERQLILRNILGQIIFTATVSTKSIDVNLNEYAEGIYSLEVSEQGKSPITKRIVKH